MPYRKIHGYHTKTKQTKLSDICIYLISQQTVKFIKDDLLKVRWVCASKKFHNLKCVTNIQTLSATFPNIFSLKKSAGHREIIRQVYRRNVSHISTHCYLELHLNCPPPIRRTNICNDIKNTYNIQKSFAATYHCYPDSVGPMLMTCRSPASQNRLPEAQKPMWRDGHFDVSDSIRKKSQGRQ